MMPSVPVPGPRCFRCGVTLVELVVCMAIVSFLAFAGLFAWIRATSMEQNLLVEARARTTLCQHLERLERSISLARSIHWETNGVVLSSLAELDPSAGYEICLDYPLEANGVSFETNRVSHVTAVRIHAYPNRIYAVVSNTVDQIPGVKRYAMDVDSGFAVESRWMRLSRLSVTNVFDSADLLEVALDADFLVRRSDGLSTEWKPLHVARYVRFWNVKEEKVR